MSFGDEERLFVSLEARVSDFEKQMQRAERRGAKTHQSLQRGSRTATRAIEADMVRATTRVNTALASTSAQIGAFGRSAARGVAGMLGGALAVREIARMADTWSDLTARVQNAIGAHENAGDVMSRLSEMAQRTYSSLEQTTESWLSNAQALTALGYSTQQQLDLTESLNNALVISATKGQRAESVLNAWGKAMAFGELRGENLNTVLASGGRLAQALADSMGVSTLELRKLGSEGKITGREMFGVTRELEQLRAEADAMPATISDALTKLQNAMLTFVGTTDQAAGASGKLADALNFIAENFEGFAVGGASLATAQMARMAAGAVGLGATLGPVGAILAAAATAIYLLHDSMDEAATATAALDTNFNHLADIARQAHGDLMSAAASLRSLGETEVANALFDAATELDALLLGFATGEIAADDFADRLKGVEERATAALGSLEDVDRAQFGMAISQIGRLGAALSSTAGRARELRAELDAATTAARSQAAVFREAEMNSRTAYEGHKAASDDFLVSEGERNAMSRERLDLEREVERTQKRAAAAGVTLTRAQAEAAAAAATAAEERRRAENKAEREAARPAARGGGRSTAAAEPDDSFAREIAQLQRRTDLTKALTAVQAQLNPLVNDHGFALEKARTEQELLADAQEAGVALTDTLRQQVGELASAYADAAAEAHRLDESQQGVVAAAEESARLQRDVVGGLVSGLREGKDASDLLADSLAKIADRLQNMVLDSLFPAAGGGAGGILSGLFGGLFGGVPGFANGGVTPGGPVWVGERGRELVDLPAGSRVTPHAASEAAAARANKRTGAEVGGSVMHAKIVNVIDPADIMTASLASSPGQQVFMNFIAANSRRINAALGG